MNMSDAILVIQIASTNELEVPVMRLIAMGKEANSYVHGSDKRDKAGLAMIDLAKQIKQSPNYTKFAKTCSINKNSAIVELIDRMGGQ